MIIWPVPWLRTCAAAGAVGFQDPFNFEFQLVCGKVMDLQLCGDFGINSQ
jgi:hypothetical protein